MAKPGDTRKSSTGATWVWTGSGWVPMPKLKAQQTALMKKIKEQNASNPLSDWFKAATSTAAQMQNKPNAERSWKSRGAVSGTVSSAMNSRKPKSGFGASTVSSQSLMPNKKKDIKKPADKKKPSITEPSVTKPSTTRPSSTPSTRSAGASAAGGGRRPSVSQSRTMWVKKGDVVGGKTVQKGYLAQYGKPEKRVTARVRAEAGNTAGMKTGSVTRYKAGRKVKKGR